MRRTRARTLTTMALLLVGVLLLGMPGQPWASMLTYWTTWGNYTAPTDYSYWDDDLGEFVWVYPEGRLNAIDALSESMAWAVGYRYQISPTEGAGALISYCTGGVWDRTKEVVLAGVPELRGVAAVDATHVWAVGDGGRIYSRGASDAVWNLQASGWPNLRGVSFADTTRGWAVGASGTIVRTTNGSTWAADGTSPTTAGLNSVFALDATRVWAVGDGGVALYRDAGGVWRSGTVPGGAGNLRSVHFASATHGWAVGDSRTFLATTDGGVTWAAQTAGLPPSGRTDSPKAVLFLDTQRGMAVGENETCWRTANGGATWVAEPLTSGVGRGTVNDLVALTSLHHASKNSFAAIGTADPTDSGAQSGERLKSRLYRAELFFYAPDDPTSPTFTPLAGTPSARIGWTDASDDETEFVIERAKDNASGPFSVIATVGPNVTSYDDASAALDWTSTWYYRVMARNQAGDSGYTTVVGGLLDTSAPAAPIGMAASPSSWAPTTSFTITWTNPPPNVAPIAAKRYKWDAAPTSATDGTSDTDVDGSSVLTAPSADGAHTLYMWLEDAAGNIDHNSRSSVQVYVDRTAPAAPTALAASPSGWASTTAFTVTWTNPAQSASPIVAKRYKWDAVPTSATDGTRDTDVDGSSALTAPSADGVHTLHMWLEDAAGNIDHANRAWVEVVVGSGAVLELAVGSPTHPDPSAWYSASSVVVTWTTTGDPADIAGYSYAWSDSSPSGPDDTIDTTGTTTQQTVPSDGTHRFWVRGRSVGGTWSSTADFVYNVDRTAPTAPQGLAASPSGWASTTAFTVTWTNPAQSASPIVAKRYKWDAVPTSATDGTRDTDVDGSSALTAPSADGVHTLHMWLEDAAGNIDHNNRASVQVYVDRTAPTAPTALAANPTNPAPGAAFTLTWTNPAQTASPIAAKRYKWDAVPTSATDGTRDTDVDGSSSIIVPSTPGTHTVYVWLEDAAGNIDHNARASVSVSASQPLLTVYRFYKPSAGTHFYTSSEVERDNVIANLSRVYNYEGVAYRAYADTSGGATPLYRFYNKRTGTHFYTASETEKEDVRTRLSATYNLEGIAYYVMPVQSAGSSTAHRFYNWRTGVHFYTASEVERETVIRTLSHTFNYEGPSFYVR